MGFMGTETFRIAAVISMRDNGWDAHWASLAAIVLYPLDDQPAVSRPFEKMIRKASRRAAKLLRRKSQVESEVTIAAVLLSYLELAEAAQEAYYIQRFGQFVRQLGELPSSRTGEPLIVVVPE